MDKPAFLYRYRPINDYLKSILIDSQIYFPPANTFNDPFDCKIRLLTDGDSKRITNYVEQLLNQYRPNISRQNRAKLLADIEHRGPEYIQTVLDGVQSDFSVEVGVLSLSAKRDDLLMWSHYADGHKGVCLEFSMNQELPFFRIAEPIIYSTEYPTLSFFTDPRERLAKALMTKADRYKYEEEWRIFSITEGVGPRAFDPRLLTGVIFGCNVALDNEEKVKSWIGESQGKPKLYRACPKTDRFELDITPVN